MMTTTKNWSELHDATLESLELNWSSGEAILRIRSGDATHPQRVLVATAVRRFGADRQMPWGFSASINEVRGLVGSSGVDASVLEIELQSGDVIRIEARSFSLQDAEWPARKEPFLRHERKFLGSSVFILASPTPRRANRLTRW